uniref:Uncharacterized protein n=1 Tax=Rhizophora mucronata TaxID=61149 RepID=A0A2P2QRA9_RHIMU
MIYIFSSDNLLGFQFFCWEFLCFNNSCFLELN